jgi:hypothetical protein
MKIHGYSVLFVVVVVLLAIAAGCTTSQQQTTAATQAPQVTAAPATYQTPLATSSAKAASVAKADVDTSIKVQFNNYGCINVQDLLGTTYLYPDDKFKIEAAPPGANTINVNVLFVDDTDHTKFIAIKPKWNDVGKNWLYEGIVPLVQFNDVTTSVEKSFTIKRQSKYYICADDRKEAGTQDITYQVPVKLTRL